MTDPINDVDAGGMVAALLARAVADSDFARALESVVGGTPTGKIEAEDEDLIRAFVETHGAAHLDDAATRYSAYLAEEGRIARVRAEAEARAQAREAEEAERLRAQEEQAERDIRRVGVAETPSKGRRK